MKLCSMFSTRSKRSWAMRRHKILRACSSAWCLLRSKEAWGLGSGSKRLSGLSRSTMQCDDESRHVGNGDFHSSGFLAESGVHQVVVAARRPRHRRVDHRWFEWIVHQCDSAYVRNHRSSTDAGLCFLGNVGDSRRDFCYLDSDHHSARDRGNAVAVRSSAARQISVHLVATADVWDHARWRHEETARPVRFVLWLAAIAVPADSVRRQQQ